MESTLVCKVCLTVNVKMYKLTNTPLQEIYEKLTDIPFDRNDDGPKTVCYLCVARLDNCRKLQQLAIQTDKILTNLLDSKIEGSSIDMFKSDKYRYLSAVLLKSVQHSGSSDLTVDIDDCALKSEQGDDIKSVLVKTEEECNDIDNNETADSDDDVPLKSISVNNSEGVRGKETRWRQETASENPIEDSSNNVDACLDIAIKSEQGDCIEPEVFEPDEDLNDIDNIETADSDDDVPLKSISVNNSEGVRGKETRRRHNTASDNPIEDSSNNVDACLDIAIKSEQENCIEPEVFEPDEDLNDIDNSETADSDDDVPLKSISVKNSEGVRGKETRRRHNTASENPIEDSSNNVDACPAIEIKSEQENCIEPEVFEPDEDLNGTQLKKPALVQKNLVPPAVKQQENRNNILHCEICPFETNTESHLNSHLRAHAANKSFNCDKCYYKTVGLNDLKRHNRKHTGEKPYSCTVCSKEFAEQSRVKKHLRIHTGEKLYSCTVCSKAFTHQPMLKRHLRIHTGEKPYSCTVCSKAFTEQGTLKEHLRLHTGDKPHSCTVCSRLFNNQSHLKRHLRVHTGEKPYSCTVCSKAFNLQSILKIHLRIHTGEKPYPCTFCSKAFGQRGHLTNHLRIHTGEKPYSCTVCSRVFNNQSHLKKHLKVHTGKKPEVCL